MSSNMCQKQVVSALGFSLTPKKNLSCFPWMSLVTSILSADFSPRAHKFLLPFLSRFFLLAVLSVFLLAWDVSHSKISRNSSGISNIGRNLISVRLFSVKTQCRELYWYQTEAYYAFFKTIISSSWARKKSLKMLSNVLNFEITTSDLKDLRKWIVNEAEIW